MATSSSSQDLDIRVKFSCGKKTVVLEGNDATFFLTCSACAVDGCTYYIENIGDTPVAFEVRSTLESSLYACPTKGVVAPNYQANLRVKCSDHSLGDAVQAIVVMFPFTSEEADNNDSSPSSRMRGVMSYNAMEAHYHPAGQDPQIHLLEVDDLNSLVNSSKSSGRIYEFEIRFSHSSARILMRGSTSSVSSDESDERRSGNSFDGRNNQLQSRRSSIFSYDLLSASTSTLLNTAVILAFLALIMAFYIAFIT